MLLAALPFSIWFLLGRNPRDWETVSAHIATPVFWDLGQPRGEGIIGWVNGILGEEYTVWSVFIASTFVTLATHGIDQDTVQRMLTAKKSQQASAQRAELGTSSLPLFPSVKSLLSLCTL